MTRDELFEVIVNLEDAIKKHRLPTFNKNMHRVEQILRILQVDYHNFHENESARACDDNVRPLWEKFWTYIDKDGEVKEVKKIL